MKQTVKIIPIDLVKDPERPLRSHLTPESVDDLVYSIKEVGIIQPLIVCESGEGYEVIAGHRRLLAAEVCRLTEVPCIVVSTEGIDKEIMKMHENIGRQDINPIDWAIQLDYLKSQYKLTNAKLAEMLGFSESWVSEHLAIINYPPEILEAIKNGSLAFSSARELVKIKDKTKREVYVKAAVRGGITPSLAARWKLEANREPIKTQPPTEESKTPNDIDVLPNTMPTCPVCGLDIAYEDIVTLQIHSACQPQPQPESNGEETAN